MLRWFLLLVIACALLAPSARATQLRLFDPPRATGLYTRTDLRSPPPTKPSVSYGGFALQLLPSLVFDAALALGQTSLGIGTDGSGSRLEYVGFWMGSAAVATLLTTSWVYLISRASGVKPSYLEMLGWSALVRGGAALIGSLIFLADNHPSFYTLLLPFGLGALGGTVMEISFGSTESFDPDDGWKPMPVEPRSPLKVDNARAITHVPLLALRF